MGAQRVKEEQPKEEKAESKEGKEKPRVERVTKKWKGKDWFTIVAPKSFGEAKIAETPATDPKTLLGRTIYVSVNELLGQKGRDYQKLSFRIERIDNRIAYTVFYGYDVAREFLSRVIRKRLQKVEIVGDFRTKDEWLLHISALAIMNRNVEKNIQTKVRLWAADNIKQSAEKAGVDEFMKYIVSGTVQHRMKKQGSKIYPVRFFEISKIRVVDRPEKERAETEAPAVKVETEKRAETESEAGKEEQPAKKTGKKPEK